MLVCSVNSTFSLDLSTSELDLLPGLQRLDDALMDLMSNYYGKLSIIFDKISVLTYLHEEA